jgi:hypothetical protein
MLLGCALIQGIRIALGQVLLLFSQLRCISFVAKQKIVVIALLFHTSEGACAKSNPLLSVCALASCN